MGLSCPGCHSEAYKLTRNAAFRYKAYIEQIDYAVNREQDRNQMERLATLDFVYKGHYLFIIGSSGTGESYLACALGHEACKRGFRTLFANAPKPLGVLKVAKPKVYLKRSSRRLNAVSYSSSMPCSSCRLMSGNAPYRLKSLKTGMNGNPSSSPRSPRRPTGMT